MRHEITHRDQEYDKDGQLINEKYIVTIKDRWGRVRRKEEHTFKATYGTKNGKVGYKND
jgi:hypothetical protein